MYGVRTHLNLFGARGGLDACFSLGDYSMKTMIFALGVASVLATVSPVAAMTVYGPNGEKVPEVCAGSKVFLSSRIFAHYDCSQDYRDAYLSKDLVFQRALMKVAEFKAKPDEPLDTSDVAFEANLLAIGDFMILRQHLLALQGYSEGPATHAELTMDYVLQDVGAILNRLTTHRLRMQAATESLEWASYYECRDEHGFGHAVLDEAMCEAEGQNGGHGKF